MIEIKNKVDCCGCTACVNICPKKAITMTEDEEGFLYPVINKEKCIECGLCDKTCPIMNKKNIKTNLDIKAYAARCKDKEIVRTSTSGGFFTPLAEYVIENGGIVFGVGYDDNLVVCHKEAKTLLEVQEFKGSKYVQSYLGDTFNKVHKYLEAGVLILFSGTPCQIEGLKNYLKKDYTNLITVDVICHGTPSPKLWKKYIEYQEKKYKSKIKEISFRNKTYGYHSGTMKLVFENARKYYGSARVDYMLKSFFKEISSRPSCYNCKFKNRYHVSDITIFDCWSIEKLCPNIKDDDLGYTNIIVNSDNGKNILEQIKDSFEIYEVDINEQIKLDGIMVEKSAIPNKNRENYYKDIDNEGLEEHIRKFIPVTNKDYAIEKIKIFMYRIKILNFFKKLMGGI